jgi:NADH-quinone oxidoreductase subunit M
MIPGVDDAWALVVVAVLPVAGALFALVMPGADRLALRYVGMGTSVLNAFVASWATWLATNAPLSLDVAGLRVTLDGLSAPLLLSLAVATPIALRSGAPRIFERTQFYVVTVLFAEGLLAAALVVDSVLLGLAVATVAAVPLYALVALFGGPLRGSTSLRAAMIWLIVDIGALALIAWLAGRAGVDATVARVDDLARAASSLPRELKPWLFMGLVAPGLVRLAAGPFSVWLASFLDEAPVSAAALAACGAAPLGAHLALRIAVPVCPDGLVVVLPAFAAIAGISVLLSGVIAIAERDLRRLLAQLLQAAGATSAVALVSLDESAAAAALVHVVATGAAATLVLTTVEAVERRYETRDAVELAGLGHNSPMLAGFLVLGLLSLVGVPALGAGTTLWAVTSSVARADGLAAAGLPPLSSLWLALSLVAGALLASAGVAGAARRILQPPPRKARLPSQRLTFLQAGRLFFPAAAAALAGVGAGALIDAGAGPARDVVQRARAAASIAPAQREPFRAVDDADDAIDLAPAPDEQAVEPAPDPAPDPELELERAP